MGCEHIRKNVLDKCLLVRDIGLRFRCCFKSIVGELRNSGLKSPRSLREFSPRRLTLCVEEIHVTQLISQSAYNLKPRNILKRSGMKVRERNSGGGVRNKEKEQMNHIALVAMKVSGGFVRTNHFSWP